MSINSLLQEVLLSISNVNTPIPFEDHMVLKGRVEAHGVNLSSRYLGEMVPRF